MSDRSAEFMASLDRREGEIADACTACGACAEICPTFAVAGIANDDPASLTAGVREILRVGSASGSASEAAEAWANACCSSGHCLTVCPEGINPRFMLTMARRTLKRRADSTERRAAGKAAFQKMSRGVQVLSRLAMTPDVLERLSPSALPERTEAPDVVFYTGCNMLKTPHIGLLCLDMLETLGLTYDVQGGPSACCGILQARPGDTENSGRQAFRTLDKLAASKSAQVISWCPTCQIQFGETMIPSYREVTGTDLSMEMFPVWLVQHLDRLAPLMVEPVPKRVAIYEFAGELGVNEAVRELLAAVPGLEVVELGLSSIGYNGTSLAPLGRYHKDTNAAVLDRAEALGVDALVSVYHGEHRVMTGQGLGRPFEVTNYMELLGAAMGFNKADRYKELRAMQDADAIVRASEAEIAAHGLDPARVRDVVLTEMLGD